MKSRTIIGRGLLMAGLASLMTTLLTVHSTPKALAEDTPAASPSHQVVACYFHRTVRCPTCKKISAYIEQFHGGKVEMIALEGNVLKVRLGGACLGCPLLPSTLQGWVAGTVHQFFPEVQVVSAE